jgi:aminopeptidase N
VSDSVFQTAATFKDHKNLRELYHEVAHRWNAKPDPGLRRTRWFDEAFASYFEALALRALSGEKEYLDDLEHQRAYYVRETKEDEKAINVPITQYGKYDLGHLSYLKGPWSLYVLHKTIGEEPFRKAISQYLREHQQNPATFDDFQQVIKQVTGRDMQKYFDEWFYGTESSRLLIDKVPVETIAARYKP